MSQNPREMVQPESDEIGGIQAIIDRDPALGATVVEPPPAVTPPPRDGDGDDDQ